MEVTSVKVDRIVELTIEVAPGPQDNWSPRFPIKVQATANGDVRSSALCMTDTNRYPSGIFDLDHDGNLVTPLPSFVSDAITLAQSMLEDQLKLDEEKP